MGSLAQKLRFHNFKLPCLEDVSHTSPACTTSTCSFGGHLARKPCFAQFQLAVLEEVLHEGFALIISTSSV